MNNISSTDYQEIMTLLAHMRGAGSRTDLAREVIPGLAKLLKSDLTSYTEVNPVTHESRGFIEPDKYDVRKLAAALSKYMDEHPVICHHTQTGDGRALKITDFITQEQFHDTALYHNFYGPLGVEYQISMTLPARRPLIAALVFNRKDSDFTERDRDILNLLRPYLTRAFEDARTFEKLSRRLRRNKAALESLPEGVISLRGNCRIELMTEKAQQWIKAFFPDHQKRSTTLPKEILEWLRAGKPAASDSALAPEPLIIQRETDRLHIRLLLTSDRQRLLMLRNRSAKPSAKPLESLGLSPRQAEALLGVVRGQTNDQIAAELKISSRTVQKHLEIAFKTLKVTSRAMASNIALERLTFILPPLIALLLNLVDSMFLP